MKFIYGPVKSHRLGISLGVNLTPYKTCSFNCIYCQLGKTTDNTVQRREFFKVEDIIYDIKSFLAAVNPKTQPINYVTISGSGEPTLYSRIGEVIQNIKKLTAIPVALITNSSLLHLQEVRRDILAADVIMPTLNAATKEAFAKICRAHAGINLENILKGLVALRKEYSGKIFLEIMLVQGINDHLKEIEQLKKVIEQINPDKIYLTLPQRATCEEWVRPSGVKTLEKIKNILGDKCEVV